MVWSLAGFAQEKSYQLSSHILDIQQGQPAAGVKISLSQLQPDGKTWVLLEEKLTDENGRVKDFLEEGTTDHKGIYRLTYHVAPYFKRLQQDSFYPFSKWCSKSRTASTTMCQSRFRPTDILRIEETEKRMGAFSSSHFSCLAGAISLALGTDVITQHGSQYEIFFRSEQVQGTCHHHADGFNAFRLAEEEIDALVVHRLNHKLDALASQTFHGKVFISLVRGVQHHLTHAFLQLIDVVEKDFQFYGIDIGSHHGLRI